MKKQIVFIAAMLIGLGSFAQVGVFRTISVKNKFSLGDFKVTGISNDTTAARSDLNLITEKAVKDYVDARPGGGGGGNDNLNNVTGRDSVSTHNIFVKNNYLAAIGVASLVNSSRIELVNLPLWGSALDITNMNGTGRLHAANITTERNWALPDASGVLALSVNGSTPDINGNITISTGGGTGDMLKSENLSGLANYATARTNLGLATVASTGAYADLTGKPTIPAAQVNSDWNSVSGLSQILNKPTIPTNTNQLTNGAGFISSYTETDPTIAANVKAITTNETTNLTSLAATGVGVMVKSAANTYIARTLTNGTNIAITNPAGTAGNPTIGISGSIAVANGGSGRATATTAYGLIAAGTTATGAQQTIAPGTAGQFLKSNGTTALGSFAGITQNDVANLTTDLSAKYGGTVTVGNIPKVSASGTLANSALSESAGNLTTAGNITASEIWMTGSTVKSSNSLQLLTLGNGANTISTGGILTSDSYADITAVPANGIYAKGAVRINGLSNASGDVVTASVNGTLQKRTVTEIKTEMGVANASHTHATTDITTGTLPIVRGGTGLGTIGTVGQSLRVATGGTALEYFTPQTLPDTLFFLDPTKPLKFVHNVVTGNDTLLIDEANASQAGYLTAAKFNEFSGKQNALVSGTNIKTVNGSTILGSGNITITGTPVVGKWPLEKSTGGGTDTIKVNSSSAALSYSGTTVTWDYATNINKTLAVTNTISNLEVSNDFDGAVGVIVVVNSSGSTTEFNPPSTLTNNLKDWPAAIFTGETYLITYIRIGNTRYWNASKRN